MIDKLSPEYQQLKDEIRVGNSEAYEYLSTFPEDEFKKYVDEFVKDKVWDEEDYYNWLYYNDK